MNTTEANLPTSGIHVLSGGEVDRVNGGAVSDIINGVATVLGMVLDHVIVAPRDASTGMATGRRQH